jgi:hypothetical protein
MSSLDFGKDIGGKHIGGKHIGRKIFGWESEGDEQMRKCLEDDNPGIRTLEASTG